MRPRPYAPSTPTGMRRPLLACAALLAGGTACFRVTVNSGAPLAAEAVKEPASRSTAGSRAPARVVSTREACPNGVAQVVTQRSLRNGLVSLVTLGFYTPVHVEATCAAGPVLPVPPQ